MTPVGGAFQQYRVCIHPGNNGFDFSAIFQLESVKRSRIIAGGIMGKIGLEIGNQIVKVAGHKTGLWVLMRYKSRDSRIPLWEIALLSAKLKK